MLHMNNLERIIINPSTKRTPIEIARNVWLRHCRSAPVLRDAMVEFLSSLPTTLAVTLRYETIPITTDKIRRDLHDLHAKVDRKIFGRDFHLSPTRTTYWGVIEMLDTNPHVHLGWHFPDADDANVLDEFLSGGLWQRRYAVGGTTNVQQHRSGWAAYSCKSLLNSDHVIISSGAMPA
jgi:hypothetical protein